jgi:hypothetical protein
MRRSRSRGRLASSRIVAESVARQDAPDTAHQAAAVGTCGEGVMRRAVGLVVASLRRQAVSLLVSLTPEQIADAREVEVAFAFGEESVMTGAMEAIRQDVHEETSGKLMRASRMTRERPPWR